MLENILNTLRMCETGLEVSRSDETNRYRRAKLHLSLMALRKCMAHIRSISHH